MNQSEFQIIKQAAAILDKEEKRLRKVIAPFHLRTAGVPSDKLQHAHGRYKSWVVQTDDAISTLIHITEDNVELLSPFWNSTLEEHVEQKEYPKYIVYKWRMDKEKHGEGWSLTLGDSSIDSWDEAPYYDYPDREKAEADLQVLYSLGYKFI